MKKLKCFLVFAFVLCFTIFSKNSVKAAEDWRLSFPRKVAVPFSWVGGNGQKVNDWATTSLAEHGGIMMFQLTNKNTGEIKIVFCIQHGIWTDDGQTYNENDSSEYWNSIGETYKNNIRLAGYWFRSVVNGTTAQNFYAHRAAVQMFVWKETLNATKGGGSGYIDWDDISNIIAKKGFWNTEVYVKAKYQELEEFVAANQPKNASDYPINFSTISGGEKISDGYYRVNPGQTLVLTDNNGNFQDSGWIIDNSLTPDGVTMTKDGNNIVVTVSPNWASVWNGNVRVKYAGSSVPNDGAVEFIYNSERLHNGVRIQELISPGGIKSTPSDTMNVLGLEVVGGKITLQKRDSETGTAQGDAKFTGAIYGIYDSNGNKVDEVTIGDDGTGTTKFLLLGAYTIREIKAPVGYLLSNDTYSVTLSASNLYPTQPVTENVIKGNIEILKRLDGTDYDREINLVGSQFKATLKSDPSQVYYSNVTGEDGICRIENVPYGTYEIEESIVPDEALKLENFDVSITENGKTYEFTKVDKSKKMSIKMRKTDEDRTDADAADYVQGDAELKGAEYTVYRDEALTNPIVVITVNQKDEQGYLCAKTGTLRTGTYYVKETKAPKGYLIDDTVYVFTEDRRAQTVELIESTNESKERVKRGRIEVVKFDYNSQGTPEDPAVGAVLRLTLDSDENTYYDVTIDKNGYADFVEEKSREKYYPYTIPFGSYTITEIRGSNSGAHTHFFSKPEPVVITKQDQREYRIVEEKQVTMYLQVQKTDADTNENVKLAGAKFKVWDVKRNEWVSQDMGKGITDEFESDANGLVSLPNKLDAGEYIIYETQAPAGYYRHEQWRLPENEADIGNKDKGGKYVLIDKAAMGVEDNATGTERDLYYIVDMPNEPLKGKIEISKKGELLTSADTEKTDYGDKKIPKYTEGGLKGVEYKIYAVNDIKSPDGNYTYATAGTLVDTITTQDDGTASTKDLYLGEYRIEESVTPKGYITDTNIDNVILENSDELVRVKSLAKDLNNVRQKLKIKVKKSFVDLEFLSEPQIVKKSLFGIYANQEFVNSNGDKIIDKDNLIDLVEVQEGVELDTSNMDYPSGNYYVKELETTSPYKINTDIKEITLDNTNTTDVDITFDTEDFVNDYDRAMLTLIKLSSSTNNKVVLNGKEISRENLDEHVKGIIEKLQTLKEEEIINYLEENKVVYIAGAKYKVYTDAECSKPLYYRNLDGEYIETELITNENGMVTLHGIPLGTYYFKEVEAPLGYKLSEEVVKVELNEHNIDTNTYQGILEDSNVKNIITKKDALTGEPVPKCVFEIRDLSGNIILSSVTDENGDAYIVTDLLKNGVEYEYVEIQAPDIYNINTEPHRFTAQYDEDGNWITEKMEVANRRKSSKVILKKRDFLTGEAIPNCKFELKSLETDYVVEGVTDENGEFIFEDIPYGRYTYTELEAPGDYVIDTTPHEIEINTEETVLDITNDRVLNTGDIALTIFFTAAIVSIAGILLVAVRNRREQEN